MTDDEKDRALCDAHCNSAADEYFNARPQLDSGANRRIFYAGHRKAWIERGEAVRLNAQEAQTRVPAINQPWPEQGGIYIGSRLVAGKVHHVVIPGGVEFDHVGVPFDRVEEVVNEGGDLNGFRDWRAPDQEDLMLAYINAREHFMREGMVRSIHWSRSVHHNVPWAVDFKDGFTLSFGRFREFRVRPVRLIALED